MHNMNLYNFKYLALIFLLVLKYRYIDAKTQTQNIIENGLFDGLIVLDSNKLKIVIRNSFYLNSKQPIKQAICKFSTTPFTFHFPLCP